MLTWKSRTLQYPFLVPTFDSGHWLLLLCTACRLKDSASSSIAQDGMRLQHHRVAIECMLTGRCSLLTVYCCTACRLRHSASSSIAQDGVLLQHCSAAIDPMFTGRCSCLTVYCCTACRLKGSASSSIVQYGLQLRPCRTAFVYHDHCVTCTAVLLAG